MAIHYFTDMGNAERLVQRFGMNLRYCFEWGTWFIWNGQIWERDETQEIFRMARTVVREMYIEASRADDSDIRKAMIKWATSSEDRKRLNAMVELAKSEPGIPVLHTELNTDPMRISCANGTLNLRTGELEPHQRDNLITRRIDVDYEPDAPAPTWETFLRRIFSENDELISYVQRCIGYTLTGDTGQQCLFFCYGSGRNGKSTLLETLMHIWGDYAMKAPTGMIMQKYQTGIPNDIARLVTKRLVVTAEIEENRRVDEALIKDLTGGDVLTARFLREEFFDFQPTHKLWIYGNHKPEIRGTDTGIWRRIRVIPFTVQIPVNEIDRNLKARLLAEAPGILAWAVRGCLDWQERGLGEPDIIEHATADYRAEMDQVNTFITEYCVLGEQCQARAGELYAAYKKWAEDAGEYVYSQQRFGRKLSERGLKKDRSPTQQRVWLWRGIGIVSESDSLTPFDSDSHVRFPDHQHGELYRKKESKGVNGVNTTSEGSEVHPPGQGTTGDIDEQWHSTLRSMAPEIAAAGWFVPSGKNYQLRHPDGRSTQSYLTLHAAIQEARKL